MDLETVGVRPIVASPFIRKSEKLEDGAVHMLEGVCTKDQ